MSLCYRWCVAIVVVLGATNILSADESPTLSRSAVEFDRAYLSDPSQVEIVRKAGNLAGNGGVCGWFEYDFAVAAPGWYELLVRPGGNGNEFFVDGQVRRLGRANEEKVSNLWLETGKHTLRIQHWHWSGFGAMSAFTFRRSNTTIAQSVRVEPVADQAIVRRGAKLDLQVWSGGLDVPGRLTVWVKDLSGAIALGTYQLELQAGMGLRKSHLSIPFDSEGQFNLWFGDDGKAIDQKELPPVMITAVDSEPRARQGGDMSRTLIREIDCAATAPDYEGGGPSRVVRKSFGAYRESGDVGWLDHMNATDPSWFAYKVTVDAPQRPYLVEVDYPDDALRTFAIAVREGLPRSYPTAGGVDSGAEFSLSGKMQTQTLIHWAQSKDLRVLLITAQTGMRAAASKIRIYEVDGELPGMKVPTDGGRSFANWYEEGTSYLGMYGAPRQSNPLADTMVAADRWAQSVAYMGGDTLWYTPVVYQFGLYPSNYNVSFSSLFTPDTIRVMLLECEKHQMKFIAEFHPEARELAWAAKAPGGDPLRGMLMSKDGKPAAQSGPQFSPIDPDNERWYLGMVGEFVDRYKDSPALRGVSLRLMSWANPSLNNFHSLDWGYGDATVALFETETGIKVPGGAKSPDRFRVRYDFLTSTQREAWIEWRCRKIAELHRRIRDRVRQARPDLLVYLDVFGFPDGLREAGIDAAMLGKLDGIHLVDAQSSYGRRGSLQDIHRTRDHQIRPAVLHSLCGQSSGAFLCSSQYFEATEAVVPPRLLGLPSAPDAAWMSAVVNPAGDHYLERWALALAECDAQFLSDGGNAYTLGQPLLRDFLREYRWLPPEPFKARADARDPVAVWELGRTQDFLFYAVNRERFPVQATIRFKRDVQVTRLPGGAEAPVKDRSLSLTLKPYELLTFKAPAGTQIEKVSLTVPPRETTRVEMQVRWLEKLSAEVSQRALLADNLMPGQVKTLAVAAEEARRTLDQGRIWRARTIFEEYELVEIFDRLRRQPPFIRDIGTPVPTANAVRARELQSNAMPVDGIKLVPSESICPDWVGGEVLFSKASSVLLKVDIPVDSRYWITVGHAAGGTFGPLEIWVNGNRAGTLSPDRSGPVESTLDDPVSLRRGAATIEVRRQSGTDTAIGDVDLSPVLRDLTSNLWVGVGPFTVDEELTAESEATRITAALASPFPPEKKLNFRLPVASDRGMQLQWRPVERGGDFIDLGSLYAVHPGQVSYVASDIYSPDAKRVRLVYGMDYWLKMWLNGRLVRDYRLRPEGAPRKGQFFDDITLQPGLNQLLVKIASGSNGNGLWMAISDPGDIKVARPRTR